jgi:hypothetical protein
VDASKRLHEIAARARAESPEMLRGMRKTFREAAQPLIRSAEQAAREQLPKRGGLNQIVAGRHTTVSTLTGARTAGVRLRRARKDAASYQSNRGFIHHPTPSMLGYDRSYWDWIRQEIPAAEGWWTNTMRAGSPAITPAIVAEMNRVARRIQDGA